MMLCSMIGNFKLFLTDEKTKPQVVQDLIERKLLRMIDEWSIRVKWSKWSYVCVNIDGSMGAHNILSIPTVKCKEKDEIPKYEKSMWII